MSDALTVAEFKEALPSQVRKNVDQALMDQINSVITDPEVAAVFRENVIGLASVMKEGKFKLHDYLHAVHFVSYKLLGDTHVQAWSKTFRTRYNAMVKRGASRSEIASVCSRYNSSKLVTMLMGQTLVPTHILNAPIFQQAINVSADLMLNAKSEMVRMQAAGRLMEVLKPPEVKKIELDVGMKEDESLAALRATTRDLVRQQKEMIANGQASAKHIAESKLIGEGSTKDEVIDVDPI